MSDDTDDEIIKRIKEDIQEIKNIADNIGETEFNEMIGILIQQIQDIKTYIKTTGSKDYADKFTKTVDKSEILDFITNGLDTLSIDTPQLYNFYIVIKRLVDNFKTFLIIKTTYNTNQGLFGVFLRYKNTQYYGYCANDEDHLNNIIKQIDDKDIKIIETITTHNFFDYETFSNQFDEFFKLTDKYYKNWEKGKSLITHNDNVDVLIHKETKYETPYPISEEMRETFKALNKTFTDNTLIVNKNNTVLIWKNKNSLIIKTTYMKYISNFKKFIERDLNSEGGLNLSKDDESIQKLKETLSENDKKNAFFLIECIKKFNIIKNLTERIVTIFLTTTSKNITTEIAKPLIDKIETLYTGNKIYIINALNI